jgi:hypothetical protein
VGSVYIRWIQWIHRQIGVFSVDSVDSPWIQLIHRGFSGFPVCSVDSSVSTVILNGEIASGIMEGDRNVIRSGERLVVFVVSHGSLCLLETVQLWLKAF